MKGWNGKHDSSLEISQALDPLLASLAEAGRQQDAGESLRRRVLAELRLRAATRLSSSVAGFSGRALATLYGLLLILAAAAGGYLLWQGSNTVAPPVHSAISPTSSDYVSLPYSDPSIANGTEATVRVRLPFSQLMAWGVRSPGRQPGEEVDADLLLGDDGLPQAIRIVSFIPNSAQERHP